MTAKEEPRELADELSEEAAVLVRAYARDLMGRTAPEGGPGERERERAEERRRVSGRGKFAHLPSPNEAFYQRKQEEAEEDKLTPRDRHIQMMKRLAESIPEEELAAVPADFAGNVDKYAYEDVLAVGDKEEIREPR